MHTDFLPPAKFPLASSMLGIRRPVPVDISLSHRGCGGDRFTDKACAGSTDDQGYIRGATLFADTRGI